MNQPQQLSEIEALYSGNLKEKGIASTAVGWSTEESQLLRFEKLASVIDCPAATPVSVNDYGCGYGAMLPYLIRNKGLQVSAYHGYDISQDMLAAARRELAWYEGELNLIAASNIDREADYSFVSGTFNVKFDATDEQWSRFIQEKILEMARFSRRGFAFNLLTSYVDWREKHLFYGDPGQWFDFCKRNVSKKVSILHDYALWEWTITVKL